MCLLLDGDACGTHHKSTGKCGRFIVGLVVFGVGQVVDDVGDVGVIKEPRVFSGVVGVNARRSILSAQKFGAGADKDCVLYFGGRDVVGKDFIFDGIRRGLDMGTNGGVGRVKVSITDFLQHDVYQTYGQVG